ncbi:hypothetical protein H1R20_g11431, partial [Candolleomyces eurysporus]
MLITLSRCELLERLVLDGCKQLTSAALEATLSSWPNLITIDLTDVFEVTNKAIISLAETSNKLQGVDLSRCRFLGDPVLIALAKNCPDLRRFKIGGSDLVTDIGVSAVVNGCPLLLKLDVRGCSSITDTAIREMWTHSPYMQELHLEFCDALTDLAFPSKVEIAKPGDPRDQKDDNAEGLVANTDPPQLVSEAKELANVEPQESLLSLPGLTSVELCTLVVHQFSKNLQSLSLSSCTRITDLAIEGIVTCAPGLRELRLRKCSLLTDRSVETICKLGHSLHYLDLAHVNQITNEAVKKLAQSCTGLKDVDFTCCDKLTDESVVELSKLPKLRRIVLVRVSKITDVAIYALAARATFLQNVHLSYCEQITLQAVHLLLDKARKLKHLTLTGIRVFMDPELQRFCREPPKDYNSRAAFCVYSGHGITQLRNHLDSTSIEMFDEQRFLDAIGDAPPVAGNFGSDADSRWYEFED